MVLVKRYTILMLILNIVYDFTLLRSYTSQSMMYFGSCRICISTICYLTPGSLKMRPEGLPRQLSITRLGLLGGLRLL